MKLKKNWIWDVLEIDWSDISITLNDNEINLPSSVIIPFTERYRARRLLRKHPLLFYIMLKQGKTWFSLVSCDLPEDTVLLIWKVKTKMGNHMLVEDTEKWTEKFHPWKKPSKDGKQFPQKLPGVLTPKKNDISITSDSGQCPSPTEQGYKPRYFDEPNCLSSDKENMPPIESITPPSLGNLSIEENNEIEHEATSWEANVAKSLDSLPRSSSPYPKKKTSTLEDLETDTDDNMIDMTDFFDRPQNAKRSPRPKQVDSNHEQCPTPQNSPTHTPKSSVSTTPPAKCHRNEIQGILPDKKKSTPWMASLSQKAVTQGSIQKQ